MECLKCSTVLCPAESIRILSEPLIRKGWEICTSVQYQEATLLTTKVTTTAPSDFAPKKKYYGQPLFCRSCSEKVGMLCPPPANEPCHRAAIARDCVKLLGIVHPASAPHGPSELKTLPPSMWATDGAENAIASTLPFSSTAARPVVKPQRASHEDDWVTAITDHINAYVDRPCRIGGGSGGKSSPSNSNAAARGGVTPRDYQLESYIRCLYGDTVIVLPTGSGKTLIAAMVLQRMADLQTAAAATNTAAAAPNAPLRNVGLFIAEKQLLVEEQCAALARHSGIPSFVLHSDSDECMASIVAACDPLQKKSSGVILVATPEALRMRLTSNSFLWSMVHTLVMDEVHHWNTSVGGHPFTMLMSNFLQTNSINNKNDSVVGGGGPRFVGLSASITPADRGSPYHNGIVPMVFPMTFHHAAPPEDAHPSSASSNSKKKVSDTAVDMVVKQYSPAQLKAHAALGRRLAAVIGGTTQCPLPSIDGIPQWRSQYHSVVVTKSATNIIHCMLLNEAMGASIARHTFKGFFDDYNNNGNNDYDYGGDDASSPLSVAISEIEKRRQYALDNKVRNDSLCLLFVQTQLQAEQVRAYLHHRLDSKTNPVSILVGNKGMFGMHVAHQQARVYDFSRHIVKILIATPVAEEGIDITGCDLVVRLNCVPDLTVRSFIQVKGRARKEASMKVIFFFPSEKKRSELKAMLAVSHIQQEALRPKYSGLGAKDFTFEESLSLAIQIFQSVETEKAAAEARTYAAKVAQSTAPKYSEKQLHQLLNKVASFEVRVILQCYMDAKKIPRHHLEAIVEVYTTDDDSSSSNWGWPNTCMSILQGEGIPREVYKQWFKTLLATSAPLMFDWMTQREQESSTAHSSKGQGGLASVTQSSHLSHNCLQCVIMHDDTSDGAIASNGSRIVWRMPTTSRLQSSRILRMLGELKQRWVSVSFDVGGRVAACTEAQGVPLASVCADAAPILKVLTEGLKLFGRRFAVLCASGSQLRAFSPSAIFIEVSDDAVMTPTQWRQYLFPVVPSARTIASDTFKCVSRLGLYFSGDLLYTPLASDKIRFIDDIYTLASKGEEEGATKEGDDNPPRIGGDESVLLTDGCGFIAASYLRALNIDASLVQFRFKGCKGVLLRVDDDDELMGGGGGAVVALRPSQMKFDESPNNDFCILRTSAKPGIFTLNREFINLILTLKAIGPQGANNTRSECNDGQNNNNMDGVSALEAYVLSQLEAVQSRALDAALGGAEAAINLVWSALPSVPPQWDKRMMMGGTPSSVYSPAPSSIASSVARGNIYREPFQLKLMHGAIRRLWGELRFRFRIPFPMGCKLLGCADPFGLLGDGEIFALVRVVEDLSVSMVKEEEQPPSPSSMGRRFYLHGSAEGDELIARSQGRVSLRCVTGEGIIVFRNPCVHPGDVQLCRGVDLCALDKRYEQFTNVVLFPANPATTHYSIPHRCSGGDLDGDEFSIVWDPSITSGIAQYQHHSYDAPTNRGPSAVGQAAPLSERDAVAQCMAVCMDNTALLGSVSNMHAAVCEYASRRACDPRALALVDALSLAMDFPKKGITPQIPTEAKRIVKEVGYPIYIKGSANRSTHRSHSLLTAIHLKNGAMPFAPLEVFQSSEQGRLHKIKWLGQLEQTLRETYAPPAPSASWDGDIDENNDNTNHAEKNDATAAEEEGLKGIAALWGTYAAAAEQLQDIMSEHHLSCESELFVGSVETGDQFTSSRGIGRETLTDLVLLVLDAFQKEIANIPIASVSAADKGLFLYCIGHYPSESRALMLSIFNNGEGTSTCCRGFEATMFQTPAGPRPYQDEASAVGGGEQTSNGENEGGFTCLAWSCFPQNAPFFSQANWHNAADHAGGALSVEKESVAMTMRASLTPEGPSALIMAGMDERMLRKSPALHAQWNQFVSDEEDLFLALRFVLEWASAAIDALNVKTSSAGTCTSSTNDDEDEDEKDVDEEDDGTSSSAPSAAPIGLSGLSQEELLPLWTLLENLSLTHTTMATLRGDDPNATLLLKGPLVTLLTGTRRDKMSYSELLQSDATLPSSSSSSADRHQHWYWASLTARLIPCVVCLFGRAGGASHVAARMAQLQVLQGGTPFVLRRDQHSSDRNDCLASDGGDLPPPLAAPAVINSGGGETARGIYVKNSRWAAGTDERATLCSLIHRCALSASSSEDRTIMTHIPSGFANNHDQGVQRFYPSPLWVGLSTLHEQAAAACCATIAPSSSYYRRVRLVMGEEEGGQQQHSVTTAVNDLDEETLRFYVASIVAPLFDRMNANLSGEGDGALTNRTRWKVSCRFGVYHMISDASSLPPTCNDQWALATLSHVAGSRMAYKPRLVASKQRKLAQARPVADASGEDDVGAFVDAKNAPQKLTAHDATRGGNNKNTNRHQRFKDTFELMAPTRRSYAHIEAMALRAGWRRIGNDGGEHTTPVPLHLRCEYNSSQWCVRISLQALFGDEVQLSMNRDKVLVDAAGSDRSFGKLILLAPGAEEGMEDSHATSLMSATPDAIPPSTADIRLNVQARSRLPTTANSRNAAASGECFNCGNDALDAFFQEKQISLGKIFDVFESDSWDAVLASTEGSSVAPPTSLRFKQSVPRAVIEAIHNVRIVSPWQMHTHPESPRVTLRMTPMALQYRRDAAAGSTSTSVALHKACPCEIDLSTADGLSPLDQWSDVGRIVEEDMQHTLAAAVKFHKALMKI